jgi:PAS domain S-box-containing protein
VLGLLALLWRYLRQLDHAAASHAASEARFRDVARTAGDWIWETDAQLRFRYFSDRVEQVTGTPAQRLVGRDLFTSVNWASSTEREEIERCIRARQTFHDLEYGHIDRKGVYWRFRVSATPIFDETGIFFGYRGTASDITAEYTAKRNSERRKELLETTFETVTQGISIVDADLRLAACNERFRELLDFPESEFPVGTPFEAFIRHNASRGEYGTLDDPDAFVEQLLEKARNPAPHSLERIRPDGSVLEVIGAPLPSGGFVTTYADVTAYRQAQDQLRAALDEANHANQAKTRFLANMSHELRTPLNAIIGFSEVMADGLHGPIGTSYAEYARDIRQSGQHLLSLINDILDIARVEADKIELSRESVAPARLVEQVFTLHHHTAREAGVRLVSEVEAHTPELYVDPLRVRQILSNLVGNAIKFSPRDGAVTVAAQLDPEGFIFKVIDEGPGIEAENIERVFEPFVQLENSHASDKYGAGLGLALAKQFARLHGAVLDIQSRPGHGTTMSVVFPESAIVASTGSERQQPQSVR